LEVSHDLNESCSGVEAFYVQLRITERRATTMVQAKDITNYNYSLLTRAS
jgi:hypothetical protein